MKPTLLTLTLTGMLLVTGCTRHAADATSVNLDERLGHANRELAQAYFRLGVATAHNLILKHRIAGDVMPNPDVLLRECIAHDIEMSKGTTLLELP